MLCASCSKKDAEIIFPHLKLCKKCFTRIIESRVKREFRTLEKEERLFLVKRIPLLKFVIKKLVKNPGIRITKKNPTKVIFGATLEEELSSFFSNKKQESFVMPFRNILDEELEEYAEMHKIKIKKEKLKGIEKEFHEMFSALERRRPGSKFASLRSIDKLKEMLENN